MNKIHSDITILAIGNKADYDTFRKFRKESSFIRKSGFRYEETTYKHLLEGVFPQIETEKIILFLFFPFGYWNRYIEHKHYRGTYGNRIFFRKFNHFWSKVDEKLQKYLKGKKVLFINRPELCGLYRDKLKVAKKLSKNKIPNPRIYKINSITEIRRLIDRGHSFFLKPQYGSMGKGITFLTWSGWQTNFIFRGGRIVSRKSDKGWSFSDVTGNNEFLRKLLKKDIVIEEAVEPLLLRRLKIDLRVYVFLNEAIYIYPRGNRLDRITTNITQGAKGDPEILKKLPEHLLAKAKETAEKAAKILNLGIAGMDIMIDRNLKDVYVIDVNLFPGFPKRGTFNLTKSMVGRLKRLKNKRGILWNFREK